MIHSQPVIGCEFADDLGWFNVGWNGNSLMKTPFMDKLVAQESLRLDQAYAYKYCSRE